MKLDALDDLLSKLQDILVSVLKLYQPIRKFFFRFALPLFCLSITIKVQNSCFAKKFQLEDTGISVIPQTSVFAVNEN